MELEKLENKLNKVLTQKKYVRRKDGYFAHLKVLFEEESLLKCSEFQTGLEWINTSEPLSLQSLKGKIVVLDFFTYCCINCMHILPDLHALEERYPISAGVVVIGVHSAKFQNEKDGSNIKSAVERYGITHPVVNDPKSALWNHLGVICWPTLVVLGPNSELLISFTGEGHRYALFDFCEVALEFFSNMINLKPMECIKPGLTLSTRILRYPSRCIELDRYSFVISDCANHRLIVVGKKTAAVEAVIGSGKVGSDNGSYSDCSFMSPQGICVVDKCLYVTDSDAHLVRKVDLTSQVVSTLIGTGRQGTDFEGGRMGCEQAISSPWDVCAYSSKGPEEAVDMLLIAMAGTHQIWSYFFTDVNLWRDRQFTADTCSALIGTGREENRNNSYPHKAAFAQPSGLSLDKKLSRLYVADSESSSIRCVDMKDGSVKGLVGGDRNPKNLFSYGDADGKGVEAQLQHPLHVCHVPETDYLFVADSYNHKIKLVNVRTKTCRSLHISGLKEPSGVTFLVESNTLLITDCNNHSIKHCTLPQNNIELCLKEGIDEIVDEFQIRIGDDNVDQPNTPLFDYTNRNVISITNEACSTNAPVNITYELPADHHITAEAVSEYRVVQDGLEKMRGEIISYQMSGSTITIPIPSELTIGGTNLMIELLIYYCSDTDNVCKRLCAVIIQPFA